MICAYLERIIVKNVAHHRGRAQTNAIHTEWRYSRSRLEHIGMIAHLSQLHQYTNYIQEATRLKCFSGFSSAHEIIVQKTLTLRQATHHNMFILLWHLLFHFRFQSTQQEWT